MVLAAMTVLSVNWTLRQRGLSMTREYICGLAEHQHTEDCYTQELICTQEEGDEHQHMEDCYAQTLTCGLPEHVHTAECLAEEPDAHSGGDTPAVQTAETNMSEVDGCSITMSGSGTEYDAKGNLYKTELELDFKISAEAVRNNKGYYYDYPEGIIVPNGLLKGSYGLLDKGGKTVGTYSFTQNDDGTYRVHVDFDAEFDPDKDPVNGYVRFKGEVDGSQGDDNGNISIKGSDGVTLDIPKDEITYPDNETNRYDIQNDKSVVFELSLIRRFSSSLRQKSSKKFFT